MPVLNQCYTVGNQVKLLDVKYVTPYTHVTLLGKIRIALTLAQYKILLMLCFLYKHPVYESTW